MCFYFQQSKTAQELQNRFHAQFEEDENYIPSQYNGFQFPKTPVITNDRRNEIQLFNWGLLPSWSKDKSIRMNLLNARIETIKIKPAFKALVKNRCIILSDGFFEWQWLDEKGKKKQKYLITLPDENAFAFAGLWNEWVDRSTGEIIKTYTIITREANELMSNIHNSKKRMPAILNPDDELLWLSGDEYRMREIELKATAI